MYITVYCVFGGLNMASFFNLAGSTWHHIPNGLFERAILSLPDTCKTAKKGLLFHMEESYEAIKTYINFSSLHFQ